MQNYDFFTTFARESASVRHLYLIITADITYDQTSDLRILFQLPTIAMHDELEKKYYKIREVAAILNLPTSTLRFWESKFTIISPKRNTHGTRFYTPQDIEYLRMVTYLVKEKGLNLKAAEEQLRANQTGVSQRSKAIARLHKIRATLADMLAATDSLR